MAIEDAAVLANAMHRVGLGNDKPAQSGGADVDIAAMLQHYSSSLQGRTKEMCERSEFLIRLQTRETLLKSFLARYVVPLLGDVPARLSAQAIRAGPLLEFVEVPVQCSSAIPIQSLDSSWFHGNYLLLSAFSACTIVMILLSNMLIIR